VEASPSPTPTPVPLPTLSAECAPDLLGLRSPGVFTFATSGDSGAPWFVGAPTTGKGYDSAVAYAVAKSLGFRKAQVAWVTLSESEALAKGAKPFDAYIGQVGTVPKGVDGSDPYYEVTQAIVALSSDAFATAASLTDLKAARFGAIDGTAGIDAVASVIAADAPATIYPDLDVALTALGTGEVDALVVDLPTALTLRDDQLSGTGTIVGQLPVAGGQGSYVMVLQKGSPATACVDRAIGVLASNGTLATLYDKWLVASAGVPVLNP
jgi:polar amino acid transport system substrate-binding protein